jgi:hypothetical protein
VKVRRADLSPPLGVNGGPCKVVERICPRVDDLATRNKLIELVEHNVELTNAQSAIIYDPEKERGVPPFDPFVLSSHAQYKMDLRSIPVPAVKDSVRKFRQWFYDPRNVRNLEEINRDPAQRKVFDEKDRKTVFGLKTDPIAVVTTFPPTPDPKAPASGCPKCVTAGYRAPVEELSGYHTYTDEKSDKGIDAPRGDTTNHPPGESPKSDRDRARPESTDTKDNLERHTPANPVYNTPGPSEPGQKIHVRTPGTPGEEYGHPYKDNVYPRRTEASDVEAGGLYPSYSERQHDQKGRAKLYYERYYRTHRGKIRSRAKRDYLHKKNNQQFKLEKKRRNSQQYGWRFNRLPAGGYRTNADRSREYRERKKKADVVIPFFHPNYGMGQVLDITDGEVWIKQTDPMGGEPLGEGTVPFFTFLRGVQFDTEEDIDSFFDKADRAFGEDVPSPERVATFYRETYRPGRNMDPGPGAQNLGEPSPVNPELPYYDTEHDKRKPGEVLNISPTDNNPGSAKVIPEGHDFANRMAVRVAARLADIVNGIDPGIRSRAKKIAPKMVSTKGNTRTFHVPGSDGTYTVKVQGEPGGDLRVSCSCDFWQYQGPEHWAKVGDYLLGKPRGTADRPTAKDPKGRNRLCKHAMACLEALKG